MLECLVPAKINLYLHITGKRPDGYHLLDSLIVFTDICDKITIKESDKFSLEILGQFAHLVENNQTNIVFRAAKIMAEKCQRSCNIAIKLLKNIPVGAGLGGGSADCAATILLLNDLWQAEISNKELMEIGMKLGADVPVFIGQKAAFISGIGEGLQTLETLPELYAILVYPDKALATKNVFNAFIPGKTIKYLPGGFLDYKTDLPLIRKQHIPDNLLSLLKNQRNDLQDAAISLIPEIKGLLGELSSLEGCEFARMSGSGSSCFAIFKDRNQAEFSRNQVAQRHPGYWTKACNIGMYANIR